MDESKILTKLVDHEESLQKIKENMATKSDLNRIYTTLDQAMVILNRLDQERVFTQEWIRRVEGEVERHTVEIKQLKQHLNIV